ncbi:ribokinase [Okeania sp. SIO2G5]|uniref:ribokinase n=1 Tax=Okeania sp. SIO2G5 TaxID=2607796 RepID=UPI0013C171E1|nr:ribokinase [Okeania sp. SIO2G5]NEP76343.1 ribokinase [Okeania sp. SIO2G5]
MSVIVLGSINMDLVVHTARLPQPGETLMGKTFKTMPGGKGANQAVASTQLGATTHMLGRVGNDGFGETLLASLRQYGVGCDRITIDSSTPSGIALIEVGDTGENHIIVVPGANGNVGEDELQGLESLCQDATILLLQLEIPLDSVIAAAKIAHDHHVKVILDPAPAKSLPLDVYPFLDILTPNQTEAEQLTGLSITNSQTAIAAGKALQQRGVPIVIITMGEAGVVIVTDKTARHIPAFTVEAVDMVAAGDAFNGGLAAALVEEHPLDDAVMRGMATAALAVTQSGAQESMPNSQTFQAFLSQNYKH